MMGIYSIAGGCFKIDFSHADEKYKLFETEEKSFCAEIVACDFLEIGSGSFGVEYLSKNFAHFMRSESKPSCVLFSDADWTESYICADSNGQISDELVIAAVYSALCRSQTLFLHSATVDYNGSGIVFAGPSGIGKTTQAELWQKYAGAEIINGDKIFVKRTENGFYAFASPWKGSSPYCINRNVPLKAIVVLRQSETNRIRGLKSEELLEYLVPHVFLPFWDEKCMEAALETLDLFLSEVPVFLLECRPDEEAVNIAKNVVLGE
ncbi:MAG: hypothetical protein IJ264_05525 [Clostridia bacterium]|nr:hypothetical protein [Clostridia bacterium]